MSKSRNILSDKVVAVVGVGQIGGSIALSLKGKVKKIIGVSRHPERCKKLVDLATSDLRSLKEADVVILSRTINEILRLLEVVSRYARKSALIMDVGSIKEGIMTKARKIKLNFVGGHPVAGTEGSGAISADRNLFKSRIFFLFGKKNRLAEALVKAMGAKPKWLASAKDHDVMFSITSHIPHMVAYGLCSLYTKSAKDFVGPSFMSAIRVASSNPRMVSEMISANKRNIARSLKKFFRKIEAILKDDTHKIITNMSKVAKRLGGN